MSQGRYLWPNAHVQLWLLQLFFVMSFFMALFLAMFPPHTSACVFSNISQRSCWCQLASSLCLSQCLLITHLEQGLSALRDDLITQAEIYKLAQELKALDLPQNCDLEPKGHIHTIQTSCVPAPLTLCLCSCSTPAPR